MLKAQAENISKSVAEAGASFGAALPAGVDLAKAGLAKATDFAKSAGAAVSNFASSVPSQTIPDPSNPGQTITNPAYTAFAALPGNASKLSSLSSLTGSMSGAAGGLTSAFGAIEAKANAAVAGGIADLKAFAFASQLATPATGIMAEARALSVDLTKVSAAQISKTVEMASKVKLSTPPSDAQNNGVDTADAKISETSTTVAPPKTAIFDKPAEDKISESFRTVYFNSLMKTKALLDSLKARQEQDIDAFYPGYSGLKAKKIAIDKETPDTSARTAADTAIVTEYTNARKIAQQGVFWKTYLQTNKIYNDGVVEYNILNGLFKADKTYGDVPKSVEGYIKNKQWDSNFDGWYSTFEDYKAAHPKEDFSWSSNA
jgi:hypothetical protein